MDFLKGKIRPMYFKYLAAAFGSGQLLTMPITELAVAVYAAVMVKKYTSALPNHGAGQTV